MTNIPIPAESAVERLFWSIRNTATSIWKRLSGWQQAEREYS